MHEQIKARNAQAHPFETTAMPTNQLIQKQGTVTLTNQFNQNRSQQMLSRTIMLFLFVILAFGLALERSVGLCANLILLTGCVGFFINFRQSRPLYKEQKIIFTAIIAMGIAGTVSLLAADAIYHQWSRLDLPVRYLIAAPCFLALCQLKISPQVIFFGCITGAFIACGLGVYHLFSTQEVLAAGAVGHHIMFGCLSALLGTLSLALSPCQKRLSLSILGHIAFIAGFAAASLSGSRGAWMGCAVLALLIIFHRLKITNFQTNSTHERTLQWLMGATLLILFILALSFFSSIISPRLQLISQELQGYFQGEPPISSIGARLEMWKTALIIFSENPIFGSGPKTFLEESQALIDSGTVNNFRHSYAYKHAHNQYFDTLATQGLLGFMCLLIVYCIPLYYCFICLVKPQNSTDKSFAWTGLVTIIGYLIFGLTETLLDRHLSTVFYLVMISVSLSQLSLFQKPPLKQYLSH